MLKRIVILCLIVLSLSLSGAKDAIALGGVKSYIDAKSGYQFLYPNGWVEIKIKNGVVLHDLIEQSENVSVIVNPLPEKKTLQDLGTPTDVGYKLSKVALAPPGSGREAELINAQSREVGDKVYYILEYVIKLPDQQLRHNLASVAISRGKLFTFNANVNEKRWPKVKTILEPVVNSFAVD